MTVKELIDELNKIEDKDKPVWVHSYDDDTPCDTVIANKYPYVLLF